MNPSRYDTTKSCRWNFFKLSWVVHYVIFSGLDVKRFTKTEQRWLFLFKFLVSLLVAFLTERLIYTTNKWFNFVFCSFFEQDHLLNLIILEVYAKRWNVHFFSNRSWCSQNLLIFFFLFWLSEPLSIGRILS